MSLYKWLVDYVFIPLGGSRRSSPVVYRNIMLVMLISGVWHGAGLNFVVWGAWHGALLMIHRWWSRHGAAHPGTGEPNPSRWASRLASVAVTYLAVNVGWAFFAMDLPTAVVFFRRLMVG